MEYNLKDYIEENLNVEDYITENYMLFDENVINYLFQVFNINSRFFLQLSSQLKYIIRKNKSIRLEIIDNELPNKIVNSINTQNNDKIRLNLANILLYSIKNGSALDYKSILELIDNFEGNDNLVEILINCLYFLIKQINLIALEDVNTINSYLKTVKKSSSLFELYDLLKIKILSKDILNKQYANIISKNSIEYLSIKGNNEIKLEIAKEQQQIRFNFKNSESEESVISIVNLKNFIKAKNIQLNEKADSRPNFDEVQIVEEIKGDDRFSLKGTYSNVEYFLKQVKNVNYILKEDDKNTYCVKKLLDPNSKWFSSYAAIFRKKYKNYLCDMYVDKMIIRIFSLITGRTVNKHQLNKEALEKVFFIISNSNISVRTKLEVHKISEDVLYSIITEYRPNDNDNEVVGSVSKINKILKDYTSGKICNCWFFVPCDSLKCFYTKDSIAKMLQVLDKFFDEEVEEMRLDALKTYYNICQINKCSDINEEKYKVIKNLQSNCKYESIASSILDLYKRCRTLSKTQVEDYFYIYIEDVKKGNKTEDRIEFLYNQIYVYPELFKENHIEILVNALAESKNLKKEFQIKLSMIVSIYSDKKGSLSTANKLIIADIILNKYNHIDDQVAELFFTLIIKLSEQNKSLEESVLSKLMKNIELLSNKRSNILILLIGSIHLYQKIPYVLNIAFKIKDDSIGIVNGDEIIFEERSNENSSLSAISTITASILASYAQNNDIKDIDSKVFNYIFDGFSSKEKQTRILISKTIFYLSNCNSIKIERHHLYRLKEAISDETSDVSFYSSQIYLNEILIYALSDNLINEIDSTFLDMLPKIYAFDGLFFNKRDYSDKTNNKILTILTLYSKLDLVKFDNSIFNIFIHIIFYDHSRRKQVLAILYNYTTKKLKNELPKNMIDAIENLIETDEYKNDTRKLIISIIKNNQEVSNNVLKLFCDDLYYSVSKDIRKESFESLQKASDNQELSDDLFEIIELENAAKSIESSRSDCLGALNYIGKLASIGKMISINCIDALNKDIDNVKTLEIINMILCNKQQLDKSILDKIANKFPIKNNEKKNLLLLDIMFSAVQINQILPFDVLNVLKDCLFEPIYKNKICYIFSVLIQKNEEVPEEIYFGLMYSYEFIDVKELKHQIFYSLLTYYSSSKIVSNKQDLIKLVLFGLKEENLKVFQTTLKTIEENINIELDKEIVNRLLTLFESDYSSKEIKSRIYKILSKIKSLSLDQKFVIDLTNLSAETDTEYIVCLNNIMTKSPFLLRNNFMKLNKILQNNLEAASSIIDLLNKCENLYELPQEIIKNIASAAEMLNSSDTRLKCCDFIVKLSNFDIRIDQQIIDSISQIDSKFSKSVLDKISTTYEVHGSSLRLLLKEFHFSCKNNFKINKKQSVDEFYLFSEEVEHKAQANNDSYEILQKYLLEKQAIISIEDINILIDFYELNIKNLNLNRFQDIIINLLEVNQDLINISFISNFFENILIEINDLNTKSISVLNKIVTISKLKNSEKIIKILSNKLDSFSCININAGSSFDEKENEEISILIIQILIKIATNCNLNNNSLFKTLEKHFSTTHNNKIKLFCFKGLKYYNDLGIKSSVFDNFCSEIENQIKSKANQSINRDYNLIETIISLTYVNYKAFQYDKKSWSVMLWLYDYLESNKISKPYQEFKGFEILSKFKSIPLFEDFRFFYLTNIYQYNNLNTDQFDDLLLIFTTCGNSNLDDLILNCKNDFFLLKELFVQSLLKKVLKIDLNDAYIKKLSYMLLNFFSLEFIKSLLTSVIVEISNIIEFTKLIEFIKDNKLKNLSLTIKNIDSESLVKFFELTLISQEITLKTTQDRFYIAKLVEGLFENNWSYCDLKLLFEHYYKSKENFISVLEVINDFKITISNNDNLYKILQILDENKDLWIEKINLLADNQYFISEGRIKNINELVEEIKNTNPLLKDLNQILVIDFNEIKKDKIFSNYNENDIKQWAIKVSNKQTKELCSREFILEYLKVAIRANYLITSFKMTDTQIISCLISLFKEKTKGRLLQVLTGEGKSTIICVIASYYGLLKKQVDIVTSQPALAERDAVDKSKFYSLFNLTCSHNYDKSVYIKGIKDCYKKNIVYGDAAHFQFDILREEYSSLGTRGKRKNDIVIIDEVDSMLIDDTSKIARLSTTIPGMDQLRPIFFFLWKSACEIFQNLIPIGNKLYIFYGKVKKSQDNMVYSLEFVNEMDKNNVTAVITDVIQYVNDKKTVPKEIGRETSFDAIKEYLIDSISKFVDENIKYPNVFKKRLERQIPKYVNSAIHAFTFQQDKNYVIKNGCINPVEFNSTGSVLSSTNWCDGLSQFLQNKHYLRVTTESITTNFLSNVGFFRRYNSDVIGVTGTLGKESSKQELSKVYNIDFVNIPPLKHKQFLEYEPLYADNVFEWIELISKVANTESLKQRGVLIISESIEFCNVISNQLRLKLNPNLIKMYTENNVGQEKNVEKILPGEVIVATNLAGRGTDIKSDSIEPYGGLHVIVTFLPSSQRVEEQAFGRTSRQGKKGTAQLILNVEELIANSYQDFDNIKLLRDEIELNKLTDFKNKEYQVIVIKDKLFQRFCSEVLDVLKEKMINENEVFKSFSLMAVEERWSLFLAEINDKQIQLNSAEKEFGKLVSLIMSDFNNNTLFNNPYYPVNIANYNISCYTSSILVSRFSRKCLDEAKKYFEKAVSLDPTKCCASAYAGLAWICLQPNKGFIMDNYEITDYKNKSREYINKAIEIIDMEMQQHISISNLVFHYDSTSDLLKQTNNIVKILDHYKNNLLSIEQVIKKSLRLIDITTITKKSDKDCFISKETTYKEIEKNSNLFITLPKYCNANDNFNVKFNNLTSNEDWTTNDQAVNIIDKNNSNLSNHNIVILFEDINFESFNKLFNNNIRFSDLSKKQVLDKLKESSNIVSNLAVAVISKSIKKIYKAITPDNVNLIVYNNDKVLETYMNKSASDLETIIKKHNDIYTYEAEFLNSNKDQYSKTSKFQSLMELDLKFFNLNFSTQKSANKALNLFSKLSFHSCEIEISGYKEDILEFLQLNPLQINELNLYEYDYTQIPNRKIVTKYNLNEAYVNLIESKKEIFHLVIEVKEKEISNSKKQNDFFNFLKKFHLTISCNFIKVKYNYNLLKEYDKDSVEISISGLDSSNIKIFISVLRSENFEFSLVLKDLNYKILQNTVESANLTQQDIKIVSLNTITDFFKNKEESNNLPTIELNEFELRGIHYLLEISEKDPFPWKSVLIISLIGLGQIVCGVILSSVAFGSVIGVSLCKHGIADLFYALKVAVDGKCHWKDYLKDKVISLAMSIGSIGIQGFKKTIEGIKLGVEYFKEELLKQGKDKILSLLKNKLKDAGIESIKSLPSMILDESQSVLQDEGIDYGGSLITNVIQDKIDESLPYIQTTISNQISNNLINQNLKLLLNKIYALDKITETKDYSLIFYKMLKEFTGNNGTIKNICSISLNKFTNNKSNQYKDLTRFISSITEFSCSTDVLSEIINSINYELVKNLSIMNKNMLETKVIISKIAKLDLSEADKCCKDLLDKSILSITQVDQDTYFYYEHINPYCFTSSFSTNFKINFDKSVKKIQDVSKGINPEIPKILEKMYKLFYDEGEIEEIKNLVNEISECVYNEINGFISNSVSLWSFSMVGKSSIKLSDIMDNSYIENKNQSQLDDFEMLSIILKKQKYGVRISEYEKKLIESCNPKLAFRNQILNKCKSYTKAFVNSYGRILSDESNQLYEYSFNEQKNQGNVEFKDKNLLKFVDEVPLKISVLNLVAKVNGLEIKAKNQIDSLENVLNESKKEIFVIKDINGVELDSFSYNKELGFDVLTQITNKSLDELRSQAISILKSSDTISSNLLALDKLYI